MDQWDAANDDSFDMEDCILMQFTGLLDSNGVKVWEGDIVYSFFDPDLESDMDEQTTQHYYNVVGFADGCFGALDPDGEIDPFANQCDIQNGLDSIYQTVVGNIYEHEHLLSLDSGYEQTPADYPTPAEA